MQGVEDHPGEREDGQLPAMGSLHVTFVFAATSAS
jgi:hypothetical protein